MAETFIGIQNARSFTAKGDSKNPCLAVDLAMLGVGTIDDCHDSLVGAGISTAEGISWIPDEGADIPVNGTIVSFGESKAWFDVPGAMHDTTQQFAEGKAAVFAVKLHEQDPEDEMMHLILLAGQFAVNGERSEILVGDSLRDGIMREPAAEVENRLQRTLDWAGALFSYHVGVRPPQT